ncbi:RNA polymerase sigma factor [Salinimicrobium sp. WS361]|uniref:RNA polymerase sigma factor n=1 Tax=Salinimicrobium sp. WS361 TaxID=3425123 RepID=UPI003D6DDD08
MNNSQREVEDRLLVEQLRNGSERAFKSLYEKYRRDIYAYSRSLLKSDANAEEIVQDVFMKLWMHSQDLNSELSIKAYLFTIARNLSFNFLARAANNSSLREEIFYRSQTHSDSTTHSLLDSDYESIKERAIDLLPPKRRTIFLMSRKEHKSYEDIGAELNISVSTVKTQMSKALSTLREYLKLHTDLTLVILTFFFL